MNVEPMGPEQRLGLIQDIKDTIERLGGQLYSLTRDFNMEQRESELGGPNTPDTYRLAKAFHQTYEQLAPNFGHKTREKSAVAWDQVPENNKQLIIATVRALVAQGLIR